MKLISSLTTASFLCVCAWSAASGQPTGRARSATDPHPDLTRDTTLYTMGYSHLDTQWRWDYETTIRKYILSTMVDNFRLFEKFPGYTFNFTGANRYMMMKEYYPAEYVRVHEYVRAGRWFPAGSSLEETDALVPSPESLIRNILYGNRFFREEFGITSNEYMVPDCFGFPASMPTILSHAGLKGFSTQKLSWGSAVGIPFNVGLWEGTDGSPVMAALNPGDYVAKVTENLSRSLSWRKRIAGNGSGLVSDFMYYGTGDIGGAPAEESVEWVQKSITDAGPIRVLSVPASRFFDDLSAAPRTHLPRYRGEFLLTNHSAGSLTSQAYIKRWNRKNELLAHAAEASSVVADWLGGSPYPRESLREAWRLVIGAQFHDILAGTCTPYANSLSWNDEVLALKLFADGVTTGVGTVARGMNTETRGIPVVVFNPLSIEREDLVEATLDVPAGSPPELRVFGPDGKEIPAQVMTRQGNSRTVAFTARVPPVGFVVFDVRPSVVACALRTGLSVSARTIENGRYRVTLNAAGDVASVFDRKLGRELLSAPHRLEFLHEHPRDWPAWNMDWEDRRNPPSGYVDGVPVIRVVEQGPARVALEIDREARGSRFTQRIRLAAGASGERVEFSTRIQWFTPGSSLKACFALTASDSMATYNTGAGTVRRGNNEPKKFEVPSHQWLDLTDRSGSFGVSILEDSKYGSDKPSDNTVRLTLLYTPAVRGSYRDQASQDFGTHEMVYALAGHRGDWREGMTEWQGARLNEPLIPFRAERHKGFLGKSFSFLSTGDPGVAVTAVKKEEDGESIVIRVRETAGGPARRVRVSFAMPLAAAREVDGQEQPIGSVPLNGKILGFDLSPYQIRAFAVTLRSPGRKLPAPESRPLPLNYTEDVISANSEKDGGHFGESGASFPAETLPGKILSGGVLFELGPKEPGKANAVACTGQAIPIPAGGYNRVYFLAASSEGERQVRFTVDGRPVTTIVGSWEGYVGQWDNRIWDGYVRREADHSWDNILYEGLNPGFVRSGTVAFHTTHRHLAGGADEPYAYAYLYRIAVQLPRGAGVVTLPDAPGVKILAATAAFNENDLSAPAAPLHDTLNIPPDQYARFQMTPKPRFSTEDCIVEPGGEIGIVCRNPGAVIHYTLDGTVPTAASARYSGPVRIDRTTTLSAVAFAPGKNPSTPAATRFFRAHRIAGASYITRYAPRYRGSGDSTLFDGKRGTRAYANPSWQGFEGEDCSVVLDLGQVRAVRTVSVGCLSEMGSWIFPPAAVSVAVSQDGKEFGRETIRELGLPQSMEEGGVRDISVDAGGAQGRYVRVTAKNIGRCPAWHPGAGGKAWIFADEIVVE